MQQSVLGGKGLFLQPWGVIKTKKKFVQFTNLLTGQALNWATEVWFQGEQLASNTCFYWICLNVFDHSPEEVGEQWLAISQGPRGMAECALEFRTLTVGSGWSELALEPLSVKVLIQKASESPQNIRSSKKYSAKPRSVVCHHTVPLTAIKLSRTTSLTITFICAP